MIQEAAAVFLNLHEIHQRQSVSGATNGSSRLAWSSSFHADARCRFQRRKSWPFFAFFSLPCPCPWLDKMLVGLWAFFLFGRHAYDAAPLGSGFLVKQQPRRRCNGWSWVLLYRPFKAMPPWGMPSMPGMTAVPMEHNGFPFDAEVWRSRRSFLYQVVSK